MKRLGMRVVLLLVSSLSLGWSASGDKLHPVFTPDNLMNNMRLLGPSFGAVNAAFKTSDFASAKAHVVRSRELLTITVTFWRDRKKDDAIQILRNALTKTDQLDGVLSTEPVDRGAAEAMAKKVAPAAKAATPPTRSKFLAQMAAGSKKG